MANSLLRSLLSSASLLPCFLPFFFVLYLLFVPPSCRVFVVIVIIFLCFSNRIYREEIERDRGRGVYVGLSLSVYKHTHAGTHIAQANFMLDQPASAPRCCKCGRAPQCPAACDVTLSLGKDKVFWPFPDLLRVYMPGQSGLNVQDVHGRRKPQCGIQEARGIRKF